MFKFNKDYEDLEQVKTYYSKFKKIYDNLKAKGEYPYNNYFEGKIKGIEGNDEKTAIYLLQQLRREINRQKKIQELKDKGFKEIKTLPKEQKFDDIIVVGTNYSIDSTKEFEKARIFEEDKGNFFILPKGHSNSGFRIFGCEGNKIFAK